MTEMPADPRLSLGPFVEHLKRQWPRALGAMALAYVATGLSLILPLLYQRLGDDVFGTSRAALELQFIQNLLPLSLWMLVVLLLRRVCQSVASYQAVAVTQRMAVAVRRDVYVHLHRLPMDFFDEQRTGALVSRVTNDVTTIQYLLHDGLMQIFTAPLAIVGAALLVLYKDWLLGVTALAVFPFVGLVLQRRSARLRQLGEDNQGTLSRLTTQFLESVANVRIVRAFHRESYEIERFLGSNDASLDARMRNALLSAQIECATETLVLVGFTGVILVGGVRAAQHHITPGALIAIMAYLATMRSAMTAIATAYTRYQQAVGAARRLLAVLEEPPAEVPVGVTLPPDHVWRGGLSIRGLSFTYPDGTRVFDNACAEIRPGERVALVGGSGAGKSTLASLCLGLYRPQGGVIAVDGVDIGRLDAETLLSVVSIVPQEVGLFSGSVRDNIAYAKLDATDEEIVAAARGANAHEFIEQLSDGYDTFVGDQGVKLSGGQRQRIAIARAILRAPRLLILDEATAHVDAFTAALVNEALARLMAERTVLIIAHHHAALRDADRVLVLRDGQLHDSADTQGLTQT